MLVLYQNMKIFKKSLKDYFKFSWKFMLFNFIITLIILILLKIKIISSGSFNPIGVLSIISTATAGYIALKNKFNFKQITIVGIFCFLGVIWICPYIIPGMQTSILYKFINTIIIAVINLIIYIVAALFGALFAKIKNN